MTREEVKDLLKFIIRKCDLIINNKNYTADDYVQDKVEDIAEMCHRVLDGQFGEIAPNTDVADAPYAIVTNTKTGKWFRAKFRMTLKSRTCVNPTVTIVPESINDTISVLGMPLTDWDYLPKEECVGFNKKLHVEIFNADKVKQDEYFLYNAWIQSINHETNEIVLSCDCVR